MIEMYVLGIKPGSENTARLMDIARTTPWFLIVISIIGPILEEIVFRKILFGTLYKKFNFFIAAIISSLVFLRQFILILLTYWYTLLWVSYSPSYM